MMVLWELSHFSSMVRLEFSHGVEAWAVLMRPPFVCVGTEKRILIFSENLFSANFSLPSNFYVLLISLGSRLIPALLRYFLPIMLVLPLFVVVCDVVFVRQKFAFCRHFYLNHSLQFDNFLAKVVGSFPSSFSKKTKPGIYS